MLRQRGPRSQRGMVTVELAMISVLVAVVVAVVGWAILQLVLFDQCQLTADEVARQSARSDAAGVVRVIGAAPASAEVVVSDDGRVTTVVVGFTPRLLGLGLGRLEARAEVLDEARP